jgi:hypothetical protein
MTLNEFIEELLKLQKEGKGDYKVKSVYWWEEWDIDKPPIVFDDIKEIHI